MFNINLDTDNIENDDDLNCLKLKDNEIKCMLKYIKEWNGLKVEKNNLPKTMKKYKTKSCGWYNGRKAMEYSKHLYPAMITKSKQVLLFS